MSSDKSRSPSDRYYDYTGVVSQQGRVIVDRDFNALQNIIDSRVEADALDIIGPCGTPDDGFAISLIETSPPSVLQSPPSVLQSPPTGHSLDFLIAPGTMYVGGQRVVFPPRPAGHPITYSYFDQPDWISPTQPASFQFSATELVYLHLWELEVSAVEDPDLLDAALGGVDTTQRLRLLRRVRRRQVTSADCTAAWQQLTAAWLAGGQFLDPQSLALLPQAKLQVSFVQAAGFVDPCDPVATGGYLGAENQLIRVQIALSDPSNPASGRVVVWGYDNASFMYRVAAVKSSGMMLQLTRDPPDAFHIPGTGQVVEILRTAVIIETDPDTTDPLHQRSIVRCVAEPTGVLAKLARPYGPAQSGDPTNYLVLDQPLPDEYLSDPNPLFVRVWQAELPIDPAGGTVELIDPATRTTTGIDVTISVPQNEALWPGSYWLIAVRPSTPQAVYPERLLIAPQPPDGPRQWACPLAVIDWRRAVVTDCRSQFDNLVDLTKRKLGGCCNINVVPEDLTTANTLQSIIDRAAGLAQIVRICLSPGIYRLDQTLRLTSVHSGMVIEACTGGVTIGAVQNAGSAAFFDSLVMLSGAPGVTLRGICFEPPAVALAQVLPQSTVSLLQGAWASGMGADVAASVLSDIVAMIAVRVENSGNFTAERCSFRFSRSVAPHSFDIFGAGIMLRGDCSGVIIRGCRFDSDIAPTFTPKITPQIGRAATAGEAAVMDRGQESASTVADPARSIAADLAAAPPQLAERVRSVLSQISFGVVVPSPPPAVIRTPLVATVGCLSEIALTFAPLQISFCQLGDASLEDNIFHNLSWAIYSWADAITARLEDNIVTQCSGGIWIQLTNSLNPSPGAMSTLYSQLFNAITGFQEYLIFELLPLLVPFPQIVTADQPGSTPFSLFLTNNKVDAILSTSKGGDQSIQPASSSLVVLANRPQVHGAETSLVISNNMLRNANNRVATALIVVPDDQQRSVLTANLILNDTFPNGGRPSLQIIPNSNALVGLFTAVGNSLLGSTNLGTLPRSNVATDTWVPFNSIIG
jgi:hypothetical protein